MAKRAVEGGWSTRETERRVDAVLAKAHKAPRKASKLAAKEQYEYNGFNCVLDGDKVAVG